MLCSMSAPFGVEARCERASISAGTSTLWESIRIDPTGKALEDQRAPLAAALVLDVSGSMQGDPIAHVIASCEIDQPQLQQLLYDLEAGMPFLFVDELVVQTPLSASGPGAEKLRILLTVSGQWRGAK